MEKIIKVSPRELAFIEAALKLPIMPEEQAKSFTADFGNGYEMDVKICGAENDSAWTEAVLFHNGAQVSCTEPADDFLGEWELEDDGTVFKVIIEPEIELSNAISVMDKSGPFLVDVFSNEDAFNTEKHSVSGYYNSYETALESFYLTLGTFLPFNLGDFEVVVEADTEGINVVAHGKSEMDGKTVIDPDYYVWVRLCKIPFHDKTETDPATATQVIFLNEREDFMHGGVATGDKVVDLTDGEIYSLKDVEIKQKLDWKDIEEAAVGDEMSYYAPVSIEADDEHDIINVVGYPYAKSYGKIKAPKDCSDKKSFVEQHWGEVLWDDKLEELDYGGTDFELYTETWEELEEV